MSAIRYLPYVAGIVLGVVAVQLMSRVNWQPYVEPYFVELVFLGALIGIGAAGYSLWKQETYQTDRSTVVKAGAILLLLPPVAATGALMYEAQHAWQGNQAHFHADFQVVVDGEPRTLIHPYEFCDEDDRFCRHQLQTGKTKLHSHNDQQIHVHGPVTDKADATLSAFFDAFNGVLSHEEIRYPMDDGWVNRTANETHRVQVLIKQQDGDGWCAISQDVIEDQQCRDPYTGEPVTAPSEYVIAPHRDGPIDRMFIVYDDISVTEALEDVRDNDRYRDVPLPETE